jgi:hypothetical protein
MASASDLRDQHDVHFSLESVLGEERGQDNKCPHSGLRDFSCGFSRSSSNLFDEGQINSLITPGP